MAEKEEHFKLGNTESAMATNPEHSWTQQPSLPLWCLKNENVSLSEVQRARDEGPEDSNRKSSSIIDDAEDESGLELSLGLSLGGPVSKPKPRSGQKDGVVGEQRGVEKIHEETASRKLTRRDSEGSISRTQAFWQEFDISRDSQQEEKTGHMTSDVHVRERHPSSVSSLSPPISSLSSLGLSETWRTAESSAGDESKAGLAHQFWQSRQEKSAVQDQGNGKDDLPIFQALSGPASHAGSGSSAWARYGQSGVVMPLLDGFKETGEENSRTPFPISGKDNMVPSASASTANNGGQLGGDQGQPQAAPMGKGDVHGSEEIGLLASEQRHAQDSLEQQKKQEARKRRKAVMEEQKLQKKAKKEDESRMVSGPTIKHVSSRSGTPPPGSKVSPSVPDQVNPREASSPPDSQEAGSVSSGFRRTSSGMWPRGGAWDGLAVSSPEKTPEKDLHDQNEDGKQLLEIRRALLRERERTAKEKVWDLDREKESELRQDSERRSPADGGFGQTFKGDDAVGSQPGASHSPHENPIAASGQTISGSELNKVQADTAWVQRMLESQMGSHSAYQMAAALMENKELFLKGIPDLNGIQRRESETVPSDRGRNKSFGQSTSEQDKASERNRYETRNGEGVSSKSEAGNRATPVVAGGSLPASSTMMAMGTYSQGSNFPLMHMPYPFPVSVGGPNGLPFPLSYPFPYMMQFAPSADSSTTQERTGASSLPSSFQVTSNQLPFPAVGDVPAASWTPVLRPQATPPHSPPRTIARSSSGMAEEDSRNSQGNKSSEIVSSVSPAKDASLAGGGHTLLRASSLGSGPGQGGAFARLRPSPTLPPTPQVGPVRTRSDLGEAILYRDGSSVTSNSAFASLVAAVEASQGLSAAVASVNTSSKQAPSQRVGSGAKIERTSSRNLSESMEDITGATSSNKASQQAETSALDAGSRTSTNNDEGKATQAKFELGTTSPNPVSEGLISQMGQEASSLKLGCAAGQTFGGSGSSPDLPWVTCNGAGPNGKTISGVLYKYHKGQVRIVCACHGSHMSPGEFVQHAGSEDISNPEKSIVVGLFPHGSQAASAQG